MASIRSNSAGSLFRNGADSAVPALFTSISMGPNAWAAAAQAPVNAWWLVTSATTTLYGPTNDAATASARAASRTSSDTLAPAAESVRAMAAPMPRLAPVTSAWRPASASRLVAALT